MAGPFVVDSLARRDALGTGSREPDGTGHPEESLVMLNLAFETSASTGSIALGNDKVVVQSIEFKGPQRHSAALFPALVRLGITRLKLRRIVVGIGPGSFSGIRVSLAAAQGIALVQGVPVIGISSAYSVAAQYRDVPKLG